MRSDPTGTTSDARPRFCPRCGRFAAEAGGAGLCPECGERLAEPGFCPTCERDWPLSAGAACPKHDGELLASRPATRPAFPPGVVPDWVTVRGYHHPIEAEAARIRLEAEGIPTFLEGARMGSNYPYHVATGGIKLQVPQPLVQEARILLSQSWAPPFEDEDLEDDEDDPPFEPEPEAPGHRDLEPADRSSPLFWAILLAALVALLVGLALRGHSVDRPGRRVSNSSGHEEQERIRHPSSVVLYSVSRSSALTSLSPGPLTQWMCTTLPLTTNKAR
jgi:hypothetical protein